MPRNVTYTMNFNFVGRDNVTPKAKQVQDQLNKTADKTKQAVDKAKGSLQELAGAYNAMVVAKHAARAVASFIKPAINMQQAVKELTIATGESQENIDKMKRAALDAAAVTSFAPPEAVRAMKDLNMIIRDTDQATKLLIPTLSLTKTFMGGDLKKSIEVVKNIVGGFRMNTEEATGALDKLVAVQRATGVQIKDMAGGFNKLGLVAGTLGSNFNDVLPTFALANRVFPNASSAATGLLTGVQRLAQRSGDLASKFGIVVQEGGKFRSLSNIMIQFARAADLNSKNWPAFVASLSEITGKRAIKPFMAAIKQMQHLRKEGETFVQVYERILNRMGASSGGLSKATKQMMGTLQNQISLLGDAFQKVSIAMSSQLLPMLSTFVTAITSVMNWVSSTVDSLGPLGSVLRGVSGALLRFGVVALAIVGTKATVAAMARIVSVAFTFVTASTTKMSLAVIKSGMGLDTWSIKAMSAVRSAGLLRTVLGGVIGIGSKLLKVIGGPIGLLLIAWDVLPGIWSWAKKILGLGGGDITKKKKEAVSIQDQSIEQMKRMLSVTNKMEQSISDFSAAIDNWKNALKAQLPKAPKDAMQNVVKEAQAAIASIPKGMLARSQLKEQLDAFRLAMRRAAVDPKEADKAQFALLALGKAIEINTFGSKKAAKDVETMSTAIDGFRKRSAHTAAMAIAMGRATAAKNELQNRELEQTAAAVKAEQKVQGLYATHRKVLEKFAELQSQAKLEAIAKDKDKNYRERTIYSSAYAKYKGEAEFARKEIATAEAEAAKQRAAQVALMHRQGVIGTTEETGIKRFTKEAGLVTSAKKKPKTDPAMSLEKLTGSAERREKALSTIAKNTANLKPTPGGKEIPTNPEQGPRGTGGSDASPRSGYAGGIAN